MNEQRQQAYLNLIRSLLDAPSGEKLEILAAHQDLLDAGFVQKIEEVAQMCSQHGDEKTANRLQNLAMLPGEALNLDIQVDLQFLSKQEIQAYFQFLMQVLQATADSKGNPQIVYPLLAENTDKLDGVFAGILRLSARNRLWEVEADEAEDLAAVIAEFSNLIAQFPLGDKANNIEIAITGYEVALTVITREALPQQWAATQNNLALAYDSRIKGDRAENIEKAIATSNDALTVFTKEDLPQQWAATQHNLAAVYYSRIKGDRAENIEMSIAASNDALTVFTREALPVGWAATQHNLALAYYSKIKGDRAENIEKAIIAYNDALTVRTKEAWPIEWATTQNNLAVAYRRRIKGDRAENIEKAIAVSNYALTVFTREALPVGWADTQHNLALAYIERIKGDRAKNIEEAIAASNNALTVRTKEALPIEWADTKNNLAVVYYSRIKGDRAENIEEAIAASNDALTVYTRKALPVDWAMTQNNLALAYIERIEGDRAENIEKAIAASNDALTVRTREDLPLEWADTKNNLALAYRDRIKGDRAKNIEMAIAAYTDALTVKTREALPQTHAETLFGLGRTYKDADELDLAYDTFKSAIDTVESLREEIVSGEESKRKQAENFNRVYSHMIEVCLQLNKITEAIEYAERSKTRNLVEQILERDYKTIFPPDVVTQLERYRDEIAAGQYQIQNGKAENPQDLAKHLLELRQQRNELQKRYLPVGYDFDFNLFKATLNENTVIIEWYILNDKILAFIVTKTGEVTDWQSQSEDLEALGTWRNQYLQSYYEQKGEWLDSLESALQQLAAILHSDEILTRIQQHCNQLIFIPHRFLHLLPLHALPVNQNAASYSSLLDLFPHGVSYAPSCQLLQQVQQRQRPDFKSLFAVQNPTGDLNYTDLEVQVIQSYFNPANILKNTDATLTAINQSELNTYHCAHFSCHGHFDLENANQSHLILANAAVEDTATKHDPERYLNVRAGETHDLEKCLTLDKIFVLKLEKCRLVTLSACETGLIDFQNASDEYIGLSSGFLLAGSPSVVSSLWKVDDLSTSFLMIKFYDNLFKLDNLEAGDVAIALKEAQTWLRNLTVEEVVKFWEDKKILAQLRKGQVLIFEESLKRIKQRQHLPFASPYYWAGFIASGH